MKAPSWESQLSGEARAKDEGEKYVRKVTLRISTLAYRPQENRRFQSQELPGTVTLTAVETMNK